MRKRAIFLLCLFSLMLLPACSAPGSGSDPAVLTLDDYLTALVDKDEARLVELVCPEFKDDALLEFDSFSGVETSLSGLSCSQKGRDSDVTLINCEGKILARYVNETQEFNLSSRVYRLEKKGDGWQVCGYTEQ